MGTQSAKRSDKVSDEVSGKVESRHLTTLRVLDTAERHLQTVAQESLLAEAVCAYFFPLTGATSGVNPGNGEERFVEPR